MYLLEKLLKILEVPVTQHLQGRKRGELVEALEGRDTGGGVAKCEVREYGGEGIEAVVVAVVGEWVHLLTLQVPFACHDAAQESAYRLQLRTRALDLVAKGAVHAGGVLADVDGCIDSSQVFALFESQPKRDIPRALGHVSKRHAGAAGVAAGAPCAGGRGHVRTASATVLLLVPVILHLFRGAMSG
jgi:hypothetical protein